MHNKYYNKTINGIICGTCLIYIIYKDNIYTCLMFHACNIISTDGVSRLSSINILNKLLYLYFSPKLNDLHYYISTHLIGFDNLIFNIIIIYIN